MYLNSLSIVNLITMKTQDDVYKERLVNRFMEILDDFKCIDKEFAMSMLTSNIEVIGKELAQAHKLLQEFKRCFPFMGMILNDKKVHMKRERRIK